MLLPDAVHRAGGWKLDPSSALWFTDARLQSAPTFPSGGRSYNGGMASRVVLHIGAPKTGTTFLQSVLRRNQPQLKAQNVLLPGRSPKSHGEASIGLRADPGSKLYARWTELAEEARQWPGTAIITGEWFALADVVQAGRALHDLGPGEKHVVFTSRDYVEQIPSAWQETLKLGYATPLDNFLQSLEARDEQWRSGRRVTGPQRWEVAGWSILDPAQVLARWRQHLPASQLHVVTVPPRGADPRLLWERFASVCHIAPHSVEINFERARRSIGAEAARLLQEIGPELRVAVDADKSWRGPHDWIQGYLAERLLADLGGSRIALRPADAAVLRHRSARTIEALNTAGYDVVGNLADLASTTAQEGGRHPNDVTDSELLDVVVQLIPRLMSRIRAEYSRARVR